MAQKYLESFKKIGLVAKANEPLAKYTTFKIGGPADFFVEIESEDKLLKALKLVKELKLPYFILGGGSNLLVADEGYRGVIIKISNLKSQISNRKIVVGAGVSLGKLVELAAENSLTGLEFAAGIPGTVGGAVRGNAGAWGKAIGDKVKRVKVLTPEGKIKWIKNSDCRFSYRQSRFKKTKEIIWEAELELKKGDKKEIQEKIKENLAKRADQPKEPSAGCVFINPKPLSAGELIDKCGLKGKRIGNAQISPKHANFIVNLGGAKATDATKLIKLIKEKAKEKFGIDLEKEIFLLGFDNFSKEV